ncbi:DMT family transporter [Prolixibacteraceae bacterium JC049]|nr:DMT family transporter [Prolixibacteraceae bacterium JC049]
MKKYLQSTAFLAIVACILWSTAFVGIKIGLKYTTPLQFAGIRFFLSGLMILPFIPNLKEKWENAKSHIKTILLLGLLQTTLLYAFFYLGISMLPAALSAMLIGSGPLFAAIIAHMAMADDKMSWHKIVSIGLGMVGIAIISLSRKSLAYEGDMLWIGIVLLLLNNVLGGIGNVVIVKHARNVAPMVLSSVSLSFGGAVLFLISIPIEGFQFQVYPTEYYGALGWLSFLSAAAITIWFTLLRRPEVKISNLNMWKFIIPVMGAWLSWTLLPNESPDLISIIGMIVIASALLLLNYFNRKEAKANS